MPHLLLHALALPRLDVVDPISNTVDVGLVLRLAQLVPRHRGPGHGEVRRDGVLVVPAQEVHEAPLERFIIILGHGLEALGRRGAGHIRYGMGCRGARVGGAALARRLFVLRAALPLDTARTSLLAPGGWGRWGSSAFDSQLSSQ